MIKAVAATITSAAARKLEFLIATASFGINLYYGTMVRTV